MFLHGFEALLNAFTNRNARNHDNKLTPAIQLIQLEHGLDVNISFTGTGFHFHIK